ncbi:MAG: Gfo/Idh/MocA family oxidoreductase [Planctomycetes bacterium]|nr:Gfo/Idh/MocA family oxidoreductase [Planctomycetota bacterium]
MKKLRAAVIGAGHLGRHHARNMASLAGVELVAVCDPDEERGRQAAQAAGALWLADAAELPPDLDAASIAAPTPLHYSLARSLLERGVHCLVEKPMTATLEEARGLVAVAARAGRVLQVGHSERFNPVLDLLPAGGAAPRLIEARRTFPHTGRSGDTSVVYDLMIHDIDLALLFAGSSVAALEAAGGTLIGPLEDWAHCRLIFASGCVATLTASRVAPLAMRRTVIHSDAATLDIDFQARRLGVFDAAGAREAQGSGEEPLRRELEHFVDCVRAGARPVVSGEEGLAAIEIAERVLARIRG